MTKLQRIGLRLSEIRQKLNELSGKDELTAEERAEMDTLSNEYSEKETEYRAGVIAEAEDLEQRDADAKAGANGDGETAERRALLDKAMLSTYMGHAVAGTPVAGAEAELNAALEIRGGGGAMVPWQVLDHPGIAERRDDAPSTTAALGGPTSQRPILQRLFGRDILAALGVRIDSVPSGLSEWPLLTGGVAPGEVAEAGAAADAVAPTFDTHSLKPKRLSGRYAFTYEHAAQVAGIEASLRRDLADAVRSRMSYQSINGTGAGAQVTGFLARLADPTDPTAEATYADYASVHASAVDGIHAVMESEVSSVLGVDTYRHAAGVFQAGSGESGTEALDRRSASCQASSYIPSPAANIQTAILHAGRDAMRGDSIAAMWPALELIRDPYTKAGEGEVSLTWITLWDAYVAFRADAYKRVDFKLAA